MSPLGLEVIVVVELMSKIINITFFFFLHLFKHCTLLYTYSTVFSFTGEYNTLYLCFT